MASCLFIAQPCTSSTYPLTLLTVVQKSSVLELFVQYLQIRKQHRHESRQDGVTSPAEYEWWMLMKIVPRFCHVSKFQASDWLHYNARRGRGQATLLIIHPNTPFQAKTLFISGEGPKPILHFPPFAPNQAFWIRPSVPRISASFTPMRNSVVFRAPQHCQHLQLWGRGRRGCERPQWHLTAVYGRTTKAQTARFWHSKNAKIVLWQRTDISLRKRRYKGKIKAICDCEKWV